MLSLSLKKQSVRLWMKLFLFNFILLFLLIEITFRLFPKLLPDFPQWNYVTHYYFFKKNVLDRADEIGHKKPAVFFLGDSFTRGAEVLRGKEWVNLLQKKMPELELVNMGFGGSSPVEQWILFEHFILNSKAKVAGLVFGFTRGDYVDSIDHEARFLREGKEPFLNRLQKQLRDKRKWGELRRFIHTYSRFYRLVKYPFSGTTQYLRTPASKTDIYYPKTDIYLPPEVLGYARERQPDYYTAAKKYLDKFAGYAKKANVPVVLLHLPMKENVYIETINEKGDPGGLDESQREIKFLEDYAEKNGWKFLDLNPVFREKKDEKIYLKVDTHWTEEGHALTAATVYDAGLF